MIAPRHNDPPAALPPFWYALALAAVPIVVAECCLAAREWVRREHKARLRRQQPPTETNE